MGEEPTLGEFEASCSLDDGFASGGGVISIMTFKQWYSGLLHSTKFSVRLVPIQLH